MLAVILKPIFPKSVVVIAGNAPKAEFTDLAYKRIADFENQNN